MTIARFLAELWSGVERRRHPRLREPAMTLLVDGRKATTIDWSLGGCLVAAEDLDLGAAKIGMMIRGTLYLPKVPDGQFVAAVVRRNEHGEVGLQWMEMSPATFLAMSATYG